MLDPVESVPVSVIPTAAKGGAKRSLYTNDDALVENKTVAGLAGQSDMTPDL